MNPIIDEVDWYYLSALPRGIRFDEETGTFTGTPRTVGEYTIPIKVETNYGTDTKDVKIIVEGTPHPVYAIGYNAQTWSNNAEPDEYGFYPLQIPNAHKLSPRYRGFTATVSGGDKYYCGAESINSGAYENMMQSIQIVTTPIKDTFNTKQVLCGTVSSGSYSSTPNVTRQFPFLLRFSANGDIIINLGGSICVKNASGGSQTTMYISNNLTIPNSKGTQIADVISMSSNYTNGIYWLTNDNTTLRSVKFSKQINSTATTVDITDENLGYKAIKIYPSAMAPSWLRAFRCLSENYCLDNDPSKFRIGNIKDAWVNGMTAYVWTDNNNLYSYYNGAWEYVGNYDIKKLIIGGAVLASTKRYNTILMLTNDGQIYHSGEVIDGVTEAHEVFTPILSGVKAIDIAYCEGYPNYKAGTLTVLRD